MNKKSILFLTIFLIFSLITVGGVLWYSNEVKKEAEMAQKQMEEDQKKMEEAKQEEKNATPKTLQDLVDRSETITLPTVDTSKWKGQYRNEKLGIEFQYPKEEGWEVREISKDKIRDGGVCIGNPKFQYILIEGESDCILGINFLNISLSEESIVDNLNGKSLQSIKLPYFSDRVLIIDFYSLYFSNNGKVVVIYLDDYSKINEITDASYGILQTLKPLPVME